MNYISSDDDDASGNSESEVPGYKRNTLSGVKHLCTSERKIYQSSGNQRLAREETWLKYSSCQYYGTKWFLLVCTQIKKNLLRFSCWKSTQTYSHYYVVTLDLTYQMLSQVSLLLSRMLSAQIHREIHISIPFSSKAVDLRTKYIQLLSGSHVGFMKWED